MAFSTGYDMKDDFKFTDGLGKTYTALAAAWSIFLICGIIFLTRNRELPFLRIRNVPLTVSAVAILHVYWILCMAAYGLNGYFPCATEFWVMNIYLPLGIALFHLSNTKLLHVAVLQRKYTSMDSLTNEKEALINHRSGWKIRARLLWGHHTYQKTKLSITIGLLLQFVCALVIFLVSKKFHSTYGFVGKSLPDSPIAKRECRKGWEWLPSIVWQFFWSWVFAPYLLWKVRDIRDTHGWRTQTVVCCLAGFPASPMWLFALYLPAMSEVSTYYIPPLWFAPGILVIEAFMILLPCWQIVKHRRLKKETLQIIEQWEKQKAGSSIGSDSTGTGIPPSPQRTSYKSSVLSTTSGRRAHPHMYTMIALEKALQTNSTPLLLFAALKDFSGENISFLNYVREWKQDFMHDRSPMLGLGVGGSSGEMRHHQFAKAVEIYSSFVSLRYSNFPINISHNHLKELEVLFQDAALVVNAEHTMSCDSVTPFADFDVFTNDVESTCAKDELSLFSAVDTVSSGFDMRNKPGSKQSAVINVYKLKDLHDKLPAHLNIPETFGPSVFDNAAESVKYMVLTNTWPKFVDAGYAANMEQGTAIGRFQERLSGCGIGRTRMQSF